MTTMVRLIREMEVRMARLKKAKRKRRRDAADMMKLSSAIFKTLI